MSEKAVADVFNSTNNTTCKAKAFSETWYNLCVLLKYVHTQKWQQEQCVSCQWKDMSYSKN